MKGADSTGVIDFGTCGVGDPSCDLAIAWTLLDHDGRQVLRRRLDVDDPTWARGRGWALWKWLRQLVCALEDGDVASETDARQTIDAILDDYSATH